MYSKKYLDTLFLVKNINRYRFKETKAAKPQNERCENYYRESDKSGDDRGDF